MERSSVSGLVDRAVQRGLVRRSTDPEDGRAVRASLTPQAQRLASLLTAEIGGLIAPLTDRPSPSEQKRLTVLLTKVLDRLQRPGR